MHPKKEDDTRTYPDVDFVILMAMETLSGKPNNGVGRTIQTKPILGTYF